MNVPCLLDQARVPSRDRSGRLRGKSLWHLFGALPRFCPIFPLFDCAAPLCLSLGSVSLGRNAPTTMQTKVAKAMRSLCLEDFCIFAIHQICRASSAACWYFKSARRKNWHSPVPRGMFVGTNALAALLLSACFRRKPQFRSTVFTPHGRIEAA